MTQKTRHIPEAPDSEPVSPSIISVDAAASVEAPLIPGDIRNESYPARHEWLCNKLFQQRKVIGKTNCSTLGLVCCAQHITLQAQYSGLEKPCHQNPQRHSWNKIDSRHSTASRKSHLNARSALVSFSSKGANHALTCTPAN